MQIVQHSVGHDLDHCYGTGHDQITAYGPGYEEGGETARDPPGQGFDHATALTLNQLQQHHL